MSFRKILLPLQSASVARAAFSTAAAIARRWHARIDVVHTAANQSVADDLHRLFGELVAEHGLAAEGTTPAADAASASFAVFSGREAEIVAHYARVSDLIVVPHPAGGEVSSSESLHAVLFDSGRPVMIAPHNPPVAIGSRVCLAWNGTAQAASAMQTALPWLPDAQAVRILWSEDYQRRGPLAPDFGQYLALHGVRADILAFQSLDGGVGAGLLAAAADFNCDLLVMGAYSHSRLRQAILGGVTRHVLEHATIPLMMHH